LDAYSGYHQINLAVDDEETTAFITPFGIFCYTKMAFDLNNSWGYISKDHTDYLGNSNRTNVEAYIDDVVVESKKCGDLLDDLKETVDSLLNYKMKLKPKTFVFGVLLEKLLGYMVSAWGIDTDPKKVEAIEQLQPARTR
jgi:hypothetical protein